MSLDRFWGKRKRASEEALEELEKAHAARRVACPACGVGMPLAKVDTHLAKHCTMRQNPEAPGAESSLTVSPFLEQFRREKGRELITVRKTGTREERVLSNEDLEREDCPFQIVPNAVDADLAADLAKMLMRDAKASWKPSVWTVFNNTGGTNRLSATYRFENGTASRERERPDAVEENANRDEDLSYVTPEVCLQRLNAASEAMQRLVRERFVARIARGVVRAQEGDESYVAAWAPSFVYCNYYRDGTDGIAFHGDYMTLLGPRAIVAALSLGSTRLFRWHKIEIESKKPTRVFTARVPHNHAIIMWPGAQESWKHGVPTQSNETIDAHPLTQLARVSLTFRMRRPEISSRAPKCHCGRLAALKYSLKNSRYFYKCDPSSTKTCDFFARFDPAVHGVLHTCKA